MLLSKEHLLKSKAAALLSLQMLSFGLLWTGNVFLARSRFIKMAYAISPNPVRKLVRIYPPSELSIPLLNMSDQISSSAISDTCSSSLVIMSSWSSSTFI